jgi:hypothetical protein
VLHWEIVNAAGNGRQARNLPCKGCFADSLDRYIAVRTMFVGCAMKAPVYSPRIYAERPPLFWQNKAKHIVQLRRGV